MFPQLSICDENNRKYLNFSKANLVFGYAQSGKTYFLESLVDVLSGKEKGYTINGAHVKPDDYNVIYIPAKESITNHLKLNSKSLVRRLIQDYKYSKSFQEAEEAISKEIKIMEDEVTGNIRSVFPSSNIRAVSLNDPLQVLMDNLTLSFDNDSVSFARKSLFDLVTKIVSLTGKQSIVLIDDFNNDFDEESSIQFFEDIEGCDAVFVLASSHPIPQSLLTDDIALFSCREHNVFALPQLSNFLLDSLVGQPEYVSFEEYMLGRGYAVGAEIDKAYLSVLQDDQKTNFLRILTSKNPVISDSLVKGKVTIVPRNANERKIYESLFDLLKIEH